MDHPFYKTRFANSPRFNDMTASGSGGRPHLASHVFPVLRFSFGYPCHGSFQPLLARFVALRLADPLNVLLLMTVTKVGKILLRRFVLFQRSSEINGHGKLALLTGLEPGARTDLNARFIELGCFANVSQ